MGNLGASESRGLTWIPGVFQVAESSRLCRNTCPGNCIGACSNICCSSAPCWKREFEGHLAEKIVTEKEVGKEAGGVSGLPAVPADLFCSSTSFWFIYNGSEFTQVGAELKSNVGFFCCSPKGRGESCRVPQTGRKMGECFCISIKYLRHLDPSLLPGS